MAIFPAQRLAATWFCCSSSRSERCPGPRLPHGATLDELLPPELPHHFPGTTRLPPPHPQSLDPTVLLAKGLLRSPLPAPLCRSLPAPFLPRQLSAGDTQMDGPCHRPRPAPRRCHRDLWHYLRRAVVRAGGAATPCRGAPGGRRHPGDSARHCTSPGLGPRVAVLSPWVLRGLWALPAHPAGSWVLGGK